MDDELRVQSHALTVPRTATYAVLGGDGADLLEEIWLVCHGYGQLASRFIRRFDVLANGRRLIVAPEALSRFYVAGPGGAHASGDKVGASWMTREGRAAEIADQITYLDLVCGRVFAGVDRSRVRFVALGFSQGVAAVCRWASASESPPDEIIAWAGEIPGDMLQPPLSQRLARARITLVVGSEDPIANADRTKAHRAELDQTGLPHRFLLFEGGHELDARVLRELAGGRNTAK